MLLNGIKSFSYSFRHYLVSKGLIEKSGGFKDEPESEMYPIDEESPSQAE